MSEPKKIIIDEDWKSQVAAEKEAAERQSRAQSPPSESGPSSEVGQTPEASFDLLVTTFVSEAMVGLGQIPHPISGGLQFDPSHARFAIDMLEVIAEKTKGNLAPDEERGLQDVVHQLRMAYVAVSSAPPPAPGET